MNRKIKLAIETAIGGGSFSIFENGREIDFFCNLNSRSTAEGLINIIEKLLYKNSLNKKAIHKIVYSGGPGSQTGIRIGKATAKALSFAFDCECSEVSLLYALCFYTEKSGFINTAIQVSEKEFCLQGFEKTDVIVSQNQMVRLSRSDFITYLSKQTYQQAIIVLKNEDAEIKSFSDDFIVHEMQSNFARLLNMAADK